VAFADLTNDFVFRRIFATHPDILRGLLNDLLDRQGDQAIDAIEYLPSEQLPLVVGAKLSILDVRCKDRAGTTFVVEMQLIHHPGFVNRVVYNACKAYVSQLKVGKWYDSLTNVVAISICDFEIWPDAAQKAQGLPTLPMLSRWTMTERGSGNAGLLQVQYAFLELPKLPERRPDTGASQWAWLFVHAPELTEVPADLPLVYREALALANKATFTQEELDAYEKVRDEIQQVLAIAEARWAEGKAEGRAEGKAEGKAEGEAAGEIKARRHTLLRLLVRAGIALTDEDRALIQACTSETTLDRWIDNVLGAKTAADVLS
jgi:predicted transposase/invertase (TIGR01784 family)